MTDVGSQGLGLGHSPNDVRLKPDIYHCMDYHAALAPLYLEDMEDWKGPILVGERWWWWWLLILDGGGKRWVWRLVFILLLFFK